MVSKFLKPIALCLTILVAFMAGGWFFSRVSHGPNATHEVAQWYTKDAEALGIFDKVPAEDMAAAAQIAAQGLQTEIVLPEDSVRQVEDGRSLPSQVMLTDMKDIAGVAPLKKQEPQEGALPKAAAELNLTGDEVASVTPVNLPAAAADEEQSRITLIAVPVRHLIIQNTDEYKAFKRRARGDYPTVDFNKQMLVVLESDNNMPDNVFELVDAQEINGELVVSYRVNVFRLDKKLNSHTVLPVNRTQAPVHLKQVL